MTKKKSLVKESDVNPGQPLLEKHGNSRKIYKGSGKGYIGRGETWEV